MHIGEGFGSHWGSLSVPHTNSSYRLLHASLPPPPPGPCRLFAVFAFQIWPRSKTPSTLSWHTNSLMHAFGIFYFIFFTDWAYSKWDGQPAKLALRLFQNSNLLGKLLMRQWHFPLTTTPFVHLPNGQVISRFNQWMFVLFHFVWKPKTEFTNQTVWQKKTLYFFFW